MQTSVEGLIFTIIVVFIWGIQIALDCYACFKRVRSATWVAKQAKLVDARISNERIFSFVSVPNYYVQYRFAGRVFGSKKVSCYRRENRHSVRAVGDLAASKKKFVTIYINENQPHIATYIPPKDHILSWSILKLVFAIFMSIYLIYLLIISIV